MDAGFKFMIILLCIVGGGFFAGIETGMISIHRMRLRHAVRRGKRSSELVEAFVHDSDRLFGTTLTGTNICYVSISVLATSLVASFGAWVESITTFMVSLIVLTCCEYLPKSWFRTRPLDRCLRFATALRWAGLILYPISRTILWSTKWIVPGSSKSFSQRAPFVTREDLEFLVHEGEKTGTLSSSERMMIHRVFGLSGKKAGQIVTPSSSMTVVEAGASLDAFFEIARESGFTRMPVFDSSKNEYTGIINVFYVLASKEAKPDAKVEEFARPPLFIDAETPVDDVLPILRRFRQPLCLVKDRSGAVIGLLTTEDILEEIVGKL